MFCFDDLSIDVSGVLKSPTIIVLLSISAFMSVSVFLMYWGSSNFYVGCIDIYNCYIFLLDWYLDHYVVSFLISCNLYFKVFLSDMRIATPAFFCFPFAWNIVFHPLTFSLYVSLGLKWVSSGRHIYGFCFCTHSASQYLLVGAFSPFTFKVIIDIYVPIDIFLIVWDFVDLFSSLAFLGYMSL